MRRTVLMLSVGWLSLLSTGCSTFMAVRGQQALAAEHAVLSGTVDTQGERRGPLVVGLITKDEKGFHPIDYFVASVPGPWAFSVMPGTYWLGAFEDVNGDGNYLDEPALRPDSMSPITLASGARMPDIALHIPTGGRFDQSFVLEELMRRDAEEQLRVSLFALSVAGKVTTLEDPRFSRATAGQGLWKYIDFVMQHNTGIYFLEEYDPDKIPVLFVHGIGGTPIEFGPIIESMDRARFQPWFFYYPSGARLEVASSLLTQLFTRLRERFDVERAVVVAHSMGGLVTREFLLQDFEASGSRAVKMYVTISSPLGGMPSAGSGVTYSPVVVHSWRALAPGSEFLSGLYYRGVPGKEERRRLPAHMDYHMLFGFKGDSGDGVVPIASQLRAEAQEESRSLRGFDEDHTSILRSKAAAAHLNAIFSSLDGVSSN